MTKKIQRSWFLACAIVFLSLAAWPLVGNAGSSAANNNQQNAAQDAGTQTRSEHHQELGDVSDGGDASSQHRLNEDQAHQLRNLKERASEESASSRESGPEGYPAITRDLRERENPYYLGDVVTETRGREVLAKNVDVSETVQNADRGETPVRRDGTPYENLEGKLPNGESYREWTHWTPGLEYRGGQRIIRGEQSGNIYYTKDHYGTFWRLR